MQLKLALLHAAAWEFTKRDNPTIAEIAEVLGVHPRQIYRWAARPEWQQALDAFGYTGDRTFHRQPARDVQREAGTMLGEAHETYLRLHREGVPRHKLISATAEATGLKIRRLREWSKRFNWEPEAAKKEQ